jgi:hypothetical protein
MSKNQDQNSQSTKSGRPSRTEPVATDNNTPKRIRVIRNYRQLRKAIADGLTEFRLLLMGGGYSAKTITAASKGRFHVVNHIDGSSQILTEVELSTQSNIGEAMTKGAFIAEEQRHE